MDIYRNARLTPAWSSRTGALAVGAITPSHQPVRRRENAMARFRDSKMLQKYAAIHASVHDHFNHGRQQNRRHVFKQNRSAALAEWRQFTA